MDASIENDTLFIAIIIWIQATKKITMNIATTIGTYATINDTDTSKGNDTLFIAITIEMIIDTTITIRTHERITIWSQATKNDTIFMYIARTKTITMTATTYREI